MAKKEAPKQPEQSSEELALLLNKNYANLMSAQSQIRAINSELEQRHLLNQKAKEDNGKK